MISFCWAPGVWDMARICDDGTILKMETIKRNLRDDCDLPELGFRSFEGCECEVVQAHFEN